MTLRELHLFAGVGGGILGGLLLGHRCVGAVEIDPYCRRVLQARQADGCLPEFPIHDDIRTFDGTAWRGRVDVVAGGFPCQDVSVAGKRAGLDGARSGLWFEMLRVVREVGPRFVFVENVPGLLVRGFARVLGSLAELGFDAEWCVRSARDVGAPHLRKRLWILAANANREQHESGPHEVRRTVAEELHPDADRRRLEGVGRACEGGNGPDAYRHQLDGLRAPVADTGRALLEVGQEPQGQRAQPAARGRGWWATEPRVGRVANGGPARVDRLRALGNAQVPAVAAAAFQSLLRRFES